MISRTVARVGRMQRHEDKLRLGALGNAVVPVVAHFIGLRLAEIEKGR